MAVIVSSDGTVEFIPGKRPQPGLGSRVVCARVYYRESPLEVFPPLWEWAYEVILGSGAVRAEVCDGPSDGIARASSFDADIPTERSQWVILDPAGLVWARTL